MNITYISFGFYIFLIIVLLIYYIFPIRIRWWVLLGGSICFYILAYKTGWWVVLLTLIYLYGIGILLDIQQKRKKRKWTRHLVLALAIMGVVCPWFLAKNGEFILCWFSQTFHVNFVTTLGMSFYTFQIISYLVDIYNGKIDAQKNLGKYSLFCLFFLKLFKVQYRDINKLAISFLQGIDLKKKYL